MIEAVIASAVRTPVGSFHGALSTVSASQLVNAVLREAMERAQIEAKDIDELIIESVLGDPSGEEPARRAKSAVGLPDTTGVLTINKVCGLCLALAINAIAIGYADTVVAGGVENVSLAFPSTKEEIAVCRVVRRQQRRIPRSCTKCRESIVQKGEIGHEEMAMFTFASHQKALKAITQGKLKNETVLIEVSDRGGTTRFDRDEISVVDRGKKLAVSHCATIGDGAAALVIMSKEKAKKSGVRPMAKVVAWGSAEAGPEEYPIAPTLAIPKVLKKAGLEEKDIDLYQIDEVCSASTVSILKELGIDWSKVNIYGGLLASGYPLGAVAGMVSTTLLFAMKDRGARRGMLSLSLGGRDAVSLILETST